MEPNVSYTEGRLQPGAEVVKSFLSLGGGQSVGKSFSTSYTSATAKAFTLPDAFADIVEKIEIIPDGLAFTVSNDDVILGGVGLMTNDEINAKLAQNKAEVESVASSMRTEMANFRTAYVESFQNIAITLNKLESKSDATEKRLTQAQWIVSLVISISAVTLSAVIYFSNKPNTRPVAQQPNVVVNTVQPSAPITTDSNSQKKPQ